VDARHVGHRVGGDPVPRAWSPAQPRQDQDDLVRPVIESRAEQVAAVLGSLQTRRSPAARLKAPAHQRVDMRELVAHCG
jgi:hypothetical protein